MNSNSDPNDFYADGAAAPDRPGVPMEQDPPRPMGSAHWQAPPQQEKSVTVLTDPSIEQLTPVFSNAIPPRGLSGVLRRVAYNIPDYRARRWLMLMVADRVDMLEHQLLRPSTWMVAAGIVGVLAARRLRRRDRSLLGRIRALV